MKLLLILPLAAAPCFGLTILSEDHADVGVAYEDDAWELHIGIEDEINGGHIELEPEEALFYGDDSIRLLAPGSGAYAFLGAANDPVWIFPQVEQTGALFLGIGAEELNGADFVGNVSLSLVNVIGPGGFILYQNDAFGNPTVLMDSRDGFASDTVSLSAGSHAHFNWAFTAEGLYEVVFQASGVLNDGQSTFSASDPTTYNFGINQVPEPGHYALMAGLALTGLMAWRRR